MAKHSVQRKRKKRGNSFSFGRAVVLVLCFIGVSFGLYLWQAAFSIGQPTPTVDDDDFRPTIGEPPYRIVIDAGHGGSDPGKVGINQALEKDVNLQIAEKLKAFLEAEDIRVVMTRETDGGLYDENVSNKKVQDMKRRIAIIEEADPVLVVSIHQNSYQQESVKGAQVFYYATSERSRMLASMIQKEFQVLQPDNRRLEKGNDSYYLLKKTAKPIVIAECGFLSNAEEAEKLVTQEYQERVAWRIHMGIMKYIGTGQTA